MKNTRTVENLIDRLEQFNRTSLRFLQVVIPYVAVGTGIIAFSLANYQLFTYDLQLAINWIRNNVFISAFILTFTLSVSSYAIISLRKRIATTALSLGYTSEPSLGYVTSATVEHAIIEEKKERYTSDDVLSPLLIARLRLIDHINTLRNNAVTNLFIGIGIAALGVAILFWAVIQIGAMELDHSVDTYRVVAMVVVPKLSITLFIQVFSYFFLAMYRSNQQEIRYFQNEITMIDSFAAALIGAARNAPALKVILTALSKNERNRLMKKGEKPIISSDEVEVIHALSVIAKWKDALPLPEKEG